MKYLAFVGLISLFWMHGPSSYASSNFDRGRASIATPPSSLNVELLDHQVSLEEYNYINWLILVASHPCNEYNYLEAGTGPFRQEWFNYLGAPEYSQFRGMCVYGWDQIQFNCLDELWGQKESGWNHFAGGLNRAYGIPQALPAWKMSTSGDDWETNPRTQVQWGMNYIWARYDTPCNALRIWNINRPHGY